MIHVYNPYWLTSGTLPKEKSFLFPPLLFPPPPPKNKDKNAKDIDSNLDNNTYDSPL